MKEKMKKELIEWVKAISITLVFAFVLTSFVRPTLVINDSMTNTFQEYDYLLVHRRAYTNDLPEHGDVIIFQSHLPLDNGRGEKILIKRVIGLPGDFIRITDGKVYRNGEELIEPYIRDRTTNGEMDIIVPEDELFVMGDNRLGSQDSRHESVGTVPMDAVLGKVFIRIFPFNKITTHFGA
ncbi:MAG: signal peptidase I [Peptostreptococcaceae bacterium]|nr:signal peptidase I [Peptostreptococcaceae bacterium]